MPKYRISCVFLTVNIKGLKVVEAPLTGGLQLLKIGQMTVLAGGPADLINETTPLMKSYTGLLELMRSPLWSIQRTETKP